MSRRPTRSGGSSSRSTAGLREGDGRAGRQPYGEIGKRVPLHNIAAGKAILAHLSEERVEEIIGQHGLEEWTERTITDREALFSELETIREQEYARNDGETFEGFRAVASPILHEGELLGSIVVSGPVTDSGASGSIGRSRNS